MTCAIDHLIVLDFEATCDDVSPPSPQEIIEFPSVLLSAHTFEVIAEFESFVRPELNRTAQRRMAVLRPLKLVITNWPTDAGSP